MLVGAVDREVGASIPFGRQSDLGLLLSGAALCYRWLRAIELTLYQAGRPTELIQLLVDIVTNVPMRLVP
jgi:hypothetical protein